ncbi:unnamed protein product, partial [marine sediment metagenome]
FLGLLLVIKSAPVGLLAAANALGILADASLNESATVVVMWRTSGPLSLAFGLVLLLGGHRLSGLLSYGPVLPALLRRRAGGNGSESVQGLVAGIISWPWWLRLLSGWLLGLGGAICISVAVAGLARVGLLSHRPELYGFYMLAAVALALMASGTYALLRGWMARWLGIIATLPLVAIQGIALLCVAYLIYAVVYICFGPPI